MGSANLYCKKLFCIVSQIQIEFQGNSMKIKQKFTTLGLKLGSFLLDSMFNKRHIPAEVFLPLLLFQQLQLINIGFLAIFILIDLNEKWKLYLYGFALAFCFTEKPYTIADFMSLSIVFLFCFEIYHGLIVLTERGNIAYFSGLGTFFLVRVLQYMIENYFADMVWKGQVLCVIPALFLMSYVIIKMRIKSLKQSNISELKTPTLSVQYLDILEESLKNEENIHSYIFTHVKLCKNVNCFCMQIDEPSQKAISIQPSQEGKVKNQIINQAYLDVLSVCNWNNDDRAFIALHYIKFLVRSNQLARAIQIFCQLKMQNMTYFNTCINFRVEGMIEEAIEKLKYFNNHRQKLEYIIQYDLQISHVTKALRGILFDKIHLWGELCKENPEIKFLEPKGIQLVDRIQNLHQYFMFVVRPTQEILNVFKTTILYATYLVLTTNYTDFANSLVKKTKKAYEELKGEVGKGSEYGMDLRLSVNREKNITRLFQLNIMNISNDLCKLFDVKKVDFINNSLSSFIPAEFCSLHNNGLDNYMKNADMNEDNSNFIGKERELPFLVSGHQIVYLNVKSNLQVNLSSDCLVIKCIVKRKYDQMKNMIVDLQGNVKYRDDDCVKEYMASHSFRKILEDMNSSWKRKEKLTTNQITIIENDQNLTVLFDPLFTTQLEKINIEPLIRVGIKNESLKKEGSKAEMFLMTKRIKKIEGVVETNENDSQSSNTSRKDSIENVLNSLMESSSLKTEMLITIILIMVLIISMTSFQILNNIFVVWNTSNKSMNPVWTSICFSQINILMNKAISWDYDILKYQEASFANIQVILYGENSKSINELGRQKFLDIFNTQKQIFFDAILGEDNEISQFLEIELRKTLPINVEIPDSSSIQVLNMSLSSIISNLFIQVYLLSRGFELDNTTLTYIYLSQFYSQQERIEKKINTMLQNRINETSRNLIIVVCFFTLIMLLFIFPIFKFLFKNKKKHQKIYGLLASLESKLILEEIIKLEKVEAQLLLLLDRREEQISQSNIDFPSSQEVDKKRKDKKVSAEGNLFYQSISKIAADELGNNSRDNKIKTRKRVGQVVVKGSNCDRRKLKKQDILLIIFLIILAAMMHVIVWHKVSFIGVIETHFQETSHEIVELKDSVLGLLMSKIYADQYTANNKIKFQNTDVGVWVQNWLSSSPNDNSGAQIPRIQIQSCSSGMLVCKYNYSIVMLDQLLRKQIKDSFNISYNAYNGINPVNKVLANKVRLELFFAQQLLDLIQDKRQEQIENTFTNLAEKDKAYEVKKDIIGTVFYITSVCFLVFSILYVRSIKKDYVKKVTLLSILNKEMLFNNKRVESFLHNLSKKT